MSEVPFQCITTLNLIFDYYCHDFKHMILCAQLSRYTRSACHHFCESTFCRFGSICPRKNSVSSSSLVMQQQRQQEETATMMISSPTESSYSPFSSFSPSPSFSASASAAQAQEENENQNEEENESQDETAATTSQQQQEQQQQQRQKKLKIEHLREKFKRDFISVCQKNLIWIVRNLIKGKFDVDSEIEEYTLNYSDSRCALSTCCYYNRKEIILMLLKAGADVNWISHSGVTPILAAATNGHDEIVKILLCRGADPNLTPGLDSDGRQICNVRTPLTMAILCGRTEVVKILLGKFEFPDNALSIIKADVNQKDTYGDSPVELAVKRTKKQEIIDLFEKEKELSG